MNILYKYTVVYNTYINILYLFLYILNQCTCESFILFWIHQVRFLKPLQVVFM